MLRRLFRQRRRIVFLMVCVLCALALTAVDSDALRYTIKHEADGQAVLYMGLFAVVFASLTVGIAVCVILLLPGLRRTLECGGLTAIAVEAMRLAGADVLPEAMLSTAVIPVWYMLTYFAVASFVERDLLYRQGLRLRFKATGRRAVRATPARVWAATAPDPAHLDSYASGVLTRVVALPDLGKETFEVHYSAGGATSLVQIHERLAWDAPHHLKYRFAPEGLREGSPAIRGTYEMTSTARADGTTDVTVTHDYPAIGFGTWLLIWLDDIVGSEVDGLQANLEGRRDRSTVGWAKRKIAAS